MHINSIQDRLINARQSLLNWSNIAGYIHNHSPEEFLHTLGHANITRTLHEFQFPSYEDACIDSIHAYIKSLRHTPQSQILQAINGTIRSEISLQGYCHQIMHGKWQGRRYEIIKTAHNIAQESHARLNANMPIYESLYDNFNQGGTRPFIAKMGFEIDNEMELKTSLTPRFTKGIVPFVNLLDMLAHSCAWHGTLMTRHLQNAERLTAGYVHLCQEGLVDIPDIRTQDLKQLIFSSVKLATDAMASMENTDPARYQDRSPIMHKGTAHHPKMVLN